MNKGKYEIKNNDDDENKVVHEVDAPTYVEFPYLHNPKLGLSSSSAIEWIEQNEPASVWIKYFGILCLFVILLGYTAVIAAIIIYGCAVSLKNNVNSVIATVPVSCAVLSVLFPKFVVQEIFGRCLVSLIQVKLNTIWNYLILKIYIPQSPLCIDGHPIHHQVEFARTTFPTTTFYNNSNTGVWVIYPSQQQNNQQRQNETLMSKMDFKTNIFDWNVPSVSNQIVKDNIMLMEQQKKINVCRPRETLLFDNDYKDHDEKLKSNIDQQHSGHFLKNQKTFKAIAYFHGGGFVAASSTVLLQQVAPLVRSINSKNTNCQETVLFSFDYPLSPQNKFPFAIITLLQGVIWISKTFHVDEISLFGDSAGASLACYVATLCHSSKIYHDFTEAVKAYDSNLALSLPSYNTLPKIIHLVSLYGVMTSDTGPERLPALFWWEWIMAKYGIQMCCDYYQNPEIKFPHHIIELWEFYNFDCKDLKTLFLCGKDDPLLYGNRKAVKLCSSSSKELLLYCGRHGFMGFPWSWMGPNQRYQAFHANETIAKFLST